MYVVYHLHHGEYFPVALTHRSDVANKTAAMFTHGNWVFWPIED